MALRQMIGQHLCLTESLFKWTRMHWTRKSFLFLVIVMEVASLCAQDRSFGTLPLVNNKAAISRFQTPSPPDTAQVAYVQGIYNRLVQARGDFRYPVPALSIKNQEVNVAFIDYDKLEVTLESKAIEICRPFGDAAIAFLLGHELTHYYEKHAWRRGFIYDHGDMQVSKTMSQVSDDLVHETEADYLGGFLAYAAGFGMFDQGDSIIASLYKVYGLPEEIPGYPALSDRKALARRTTEKLKGMIDVFEMANILTAIGRYDEAYVYYKYILMTYQSREIYNNLGVTATLHALSQLPVSSRKYLLPIQLDLRSTASRGSAMAMNPEALLRQALLHFDAAISLDPDYAPAYLNKACVYTLLNDHERAAFYSDREARERAVSGDYPKVITDCDVLAGVRLALDGKAADAQTVLEKATAQGSKIAQANLNILLNVTEPLPPVTPGGLAVERIDNITMAKISQNIEVDDTYSQTLGTLTFHKNPQQGPQSVLWVNQNTQTNEAVLIHITDDGYTGKTSRDIAVGSDYDDILKAYGTPRNTLETPHGQILIYPQIIFYTDALNKLTRWANYRIMTL